ncbi:4'-phosphopantetheinyl transferase family protein [Shewanella youngdeokensis]|uniref:4'-phosphopantetheinyl transferase superfamily protein n=1 Tax=Shewanella youngdeokensis TaxID=2999068 RepID=A0ABZ0K0S4_9GAMM|nr:4'-phosphopantetheinyl transferase superfamily protein [Shewanella sp. DAU334]
MSLPKPLSPSVKLFFCPLLPSLMNRDTAATLRGWLPQNEIDKVERYIQQAGKDQGLMVRGYLRALLSKHGSLEPEQWQFEYGEKGKPRLTQAQFERTGIDFNLSHSGDWLLLAIVQQPLQNVTPASILLGVDIERCRSSTNIYSILNHYFSKPEIAALLALPSELQRERFFDLWALKESYIKAKGLGLALPLKSFGFDLSALQCSTLPLQCSAALAAVSPPLTVSTLMTFKQEVRLQIHTQDKTDAADTIFSDESRWHCALGHLNDDYRFAVSLVGASRYESLPNYCAQVICLSDIVLPTR